MAKPILIKRAQHDRDNPYFLCRREPAQDRELSWEARGMLWYLLSKPDDWEVRPKDLEQQCAKGRVYRILNELIEAKYIYRTEVRSEKGEYEGLLYEVHELPHLELLPPKPEPRPQKPDTENPRLDNADNTNYRVVQNTDDDKLTVLQNLILYVLVSDMVKEQSSSSEKHDITALPLPDDQPMHLGKATAVKDYRKKIQDHVSKPMMDEIHDLVDEFDTETVCKLINLCYLLNGRSPTAFKQVVGAYRQVPDKDKVNQSFKLTMEATANDEPGASKVGFFCSKLRQLESDEQSTGYTWVKVEDDIA